MGALNALQRSPGALTRNPVQVIPVLILGLVQLPQLILQSTDPLLASLISLGTSGLFIFIMPFFQGGIIGMADEALDGRTRLRTLVADGKAHYVTMFLAYLLLLVITIIIFIIFFIISFIAGIILLPNVEFSGFALGAIGLFFIITYVPVLLFVFFIQFYGQAIVLDNESSMDGIRRSVSLVRQNLLSTFGYTIIGTVSGGGLGLILVAISMAATPESAQFLNLPQLTLPSIAAISLVGIIVVSLIGSVLAVFSVAYYREISGSRTVPDGR